MSTSNGSDSRFTPTFNSDKMSVEITVIPLEDHKSYSVNGHAVYKNLKGRYQSATYMTAREWEAFRRYEKLVINNKAFARHTKATYKTK